MTIYIRLVKFSLVVPSNFGISCASLQLRRGLSLTMLRMTSAVLVLLVPRKIPMGVNGMFMLP
ncbi:hypothetical protein RchiOBHm_Chr1g0347481 [Rosa chinensis]|uniref:Uncharacterized protein n=1 Tax=Rosa chinensis TaxID=74649 RepID=A0A2P6SFA1_ROSCH|nr:hypothetical protein RchiOBHm_Chr1g0347481 [Rosa chinensis]